MRLTGIVISGGILLIGMVIGAAGYSYAAQLLRSADHEPPANRVIVSDRIHTSGQPTEAQLSALRDAGYDMVINLAPPQVFGSIVREGELVAAAGIDYVNIPVDWDQPSYEDFEFFSAILNESRAARVLVHCQVNRRASLFVFLYRVVHEGAEPDEAYEDVTSVWVPDGHWLEFTSNVLARHGIDYEP